MKGLVQKHLKLLLDLLGVYAKQGIRNTQLNALRTLKHSVRCHHRGQVGDNGHIIIPVRALHIDVNRPLHLAVQTGHHSRRVGHVCQTPLTVIAAQTIQYTTICWTK